jgi:hypothetical protein
MMMSSSSFTGCENYITCCSGITSRVQEEEEEEEEEEA